MPPWHVAVVVLLALLGGMRSGAAAVTRSEESRLGTQFALEARARLPLAEDVEVNRYVDRIGQKIVAALEDREFDYRFAVLLDPHLNAFAVPGGYVYVHAGLLDRVSNDDELAGVLGHEVAHIHKHHLARQREATKLLDYAALLGVLAAIVQPALGAGAIAVSEAAKLKYGRDFEQEADYLGARYMEQAGYDVRGMLDFYKKMMDEQRARPQNTPPYLLTHPLSDARLTNLEAASGQQQWKERARRRASLDLERVRLLLGARSGTPQDTVALYRRRAESAPRSAAAHYLFGLAQLESGALDGARRSLERARELGFPSIERELGRVFLRQRRLEDARLHLQHAVEADPRDAVAQRELGKTLEIQENRQGAMRAYENSLSAFPAQADVHHSLGMLAGRAGDEGDGLYHLAKASYYRGQYEKAVGYFEKAESLLPDGDPRTADTRETIAELKAFLSRR